MGSTVQKLIQRYRYSTILLRQLVISDFKLRYQGSVLGYLWSLLRPLLLFITLYIVFTYFLPVGNNIPHKPQYLLLGIVLWNYFVEVTSGSVGAIVGKGDLLRKINFPKYVVILAVSVSALINLGLNAIIVAVFLAIGHVSLSWEALWIFPIIFELFVLSLAFAFFLSALFVKFRDVSYIWEVILQMAFYGTPILYLLTDVAVKHQRVAQLLVLNPMAQIIQDARYVLITHQAATLTSMLPGRPLLWLIPFAFTVILAVVAALYFRRHSRFFAEEV
jgi:ABC-2 type transport system permease protein